MEINYKKAVNIGLFTRVCCTVMLCY